MDHAHILLFLLIDLVIIILAARAFGIAARFIGQPSVIGEVVAGILLGPTVLGRLFPKVPAYLFPPEVPLREIADLGLVFFMFLVGLEMDTSLMKKEARRSFLISVSGILSPFFLGMGLAYLMAHVNDDGAFLEGTPRPTTLTFAIFLGASMCITAFPILARFLVETGLYKTPLGISALCAAAVDDAIAWILLAAVIGITKTGSPVAALPALGMTLAFTAFMFTVGRWLLNLVAQRYDKTGRLTIDQVAIIIAGVLASAWCTELIGIHAIFGAFIFGVVMPKRSGMTHALTEKIEDFTVIVLLPIFFAVVGLRTNLLTLNSVELLGWTLLILLVAIVGKFVGTGLAAYLTGSSKRDSIVVGALMNTRGLTELVILSIGLSLGVLSDRTFAMMVIMALATTVMAAPIVNRLVGADEIIKNLVRAPGESGDAPAVRVLVAIGNLLNAPALIHAAVTMTGARRPAELLLVKLIPTPRAPEFSSGLVDLDRQIDATVGELEPLIEQAKNAGVAARVICFLTENVGLDLARIAADQNCAAILLGWHGALLKTDVLRALVHRTFVAARCDVAVLIDRKARMLGPVEGRPVVVFLSGGAHDRAARDLAVHVARKLSTGIRLVGYLNRDAKAPALGEEAAQLSQLNHLPVEAASLGDSLLPTVQKEMENAALGVVVVSDDWLMEQDFGNPTNEIAGIAGRPLLVLRSANWVGEGSSALNAAPATGQAH